MKAIWVCAALAAVGCKGQDQDAAKDEPRRDVPDGLAIDLPVGDGVDVLRDRMTAVALQGNAWIPVDLATWGDARDRLIVFGKKTEIPKADAVTLDAITPSPDRPLIVLADAETKIGELTPAITKLAGSCWGLGVGGAEYLRALVPKHCPPRLLRAEAVELVVYLASDGVWLGQTRINETQQVALGDVARALREIKASTFFEENDLFEIAAYESAPLRDVAAVLDAAVKAGFTTWRWVRPEQLQPALILDGVATDPEPIEPSEYGDPEDAGVPPIDAGPRAATPSSKLVFGGVSGDFSGGLTSDEITRVVKSRKGTLTACYERALRDQPDLAGGKVVVLVAVGADGKVTSATVKESALHDDGAESCIERQLQGLKFPAKGGATFQVPLTYSAASQPR